MAPSNGAICLEQSGTVKGQGAGMRESTNSPGADWDSCQPGESVFASSEIAQLRAGG